MFQRSSEWVNQQNEQQSKRLEIIKKLHESYK